MVEAATTPLTQEMVRQQQLVVATHKLVQVELAQELAATVATEVMAQAQAHLVVPQAQEVELPTLVAQAVISHLLAAQLA